MISKEEFHQKCREMLPKEEIDAIEKSSTKQKKVTLFVCIIQLIIGLVLLPISFTYGIVIIIFIGITILVISSIFSMNMSKYKKKYSNEIIKCLMTNYNYSYNAKGYIPSQIFKNSPYKETFDSYKGEDLLVVDIPKDDGTPSGVQLNVCDLHLTETRTRYDSKGNRETYDATVFEGVFGYVNFPFQFKCDLFLNKSGFKLKKIQLEDISFNKKFSTFTDNQLEALIILTPSLMTRLLTYANQMSGFSLCFTQEGKLYFRMSRNLFEIKMSKSKLDP